MKTTPNDNNYYKMLYEQSKSKVLELEKQLQESKDLFKLLNNEKRNMINTYETTIKKIRSTNERSNKNIPLESNNCNFNEVDTNFNRPCNVVDGNSDAYSNKIFIDASHRLNTIDRNREQDLYANKRNVMQNNRNDGEAFYRHNRSLSINNKSINSIEYNEPKYVVQGDKMYSQELSSSRHNNKQVEMSRFVDRSKYRHSQL